MSKDGFAARGLLALGLLTGCAHAEEVPAPAPPTVTASTPTATARTLVPRRVLFGNPQRGAPQISPDGAWLSFAAPKDGVMNLWVAPTEDPAAARAITDDHGRGVRFGGWSPSGSHMLYVQDRDGDENWHIYAVDPATARSRDLTPLDGVKAQIVGASDERPGTILVGLNDRDPRFHDVYSVDLATGERTLVEQNEQGFASYTADSTLALRVATKALSDGGMEVYTRQGEAWSKLWTIGQDDAMTTSVQGLDRQGRYLYLRDSRGRETAALVEYDLQSGDSKVLAEHPEASASWIQRDPQTYRPRAVAFDYLKAQWQILDDSVRGDFNRLANETTGVPIVMGSTRDDTKWIVSELEDDSPQRYYLYDRESKALTLLFVDRDDLLGVELAPMLPRVIEARDGLALVSYLTLPPDADADGDGVPEKPVPLVLTVHGGPWARNLWGYYAKHQWLANRGYAALSVNFRGSTGFTKSHLNAGDLEWGGKMHDDLLDAVAWAVDEGITTEDRVAIMGGSYGGYAALVGAAMTPGKFACAVDVVGPSSLETLINSIPPYWASLRSTFVTRMGDPDTPEGRALLEERSPLTHAADIESPLLIAHGANDPRVKQAEAEQIVAAMQEHEIPVTYVLFPDEGHGFRRPENNRAFHAVAEAFLAQCLGGDYEPVGDDFEGSSITVPVGAEHVPGVGEALQRE